MKTLIFELLQTTKHPEVRETIVRLTPYFHRIIKTPRDLEIAVSLLSSAQASALQRALIGTLPLLLEEIKEKDDLDFASDFLALEAPVETLS